MIYRFSIFVLIVGVFGLASCKNNDEVFKTVTYSAVNVVNASADTLNFYLNGTRQNNASSLYPGGQSGYLGIPTGAENFQFKKPKIATALFSLPLTIKDSTTYSVFLTGETAAGAFSDVDLLDTAGINDELHFRLRFVNAAPDAGALTVTVDSTSYTNTAFKSISSFLLYGEGPKEVKVFQTGSSTAKIDTTITFEPGTLYTIFSKGLLNGKGTAAFSLGVSTNPFN
jgi:hypothetical protein